MFIMASRKDTHTHTHTHTHTLTHTHTHTHIHIVLHNFIYIRIEFIPQVKL